MSARGAMALLVSLVATAVIAATSHKTPQEKGMHAKTEESRTLRYAVLTRRRESAFQPQMQLREIDQGRLDISHERDRRK